MENGGEVQAVVAVAMVWGGGGIGSGGVSQTTSQQSLLGSQDSCLTVTVVGQSEIQNYIYKCEMA